MVFDVVINDVDVMPTFIFPHVLRLYIEFYIKRLKKVVLPWIKNVAAERLCLGPGVCAMSHKQKNPVLVVRTFLQLQGS